MLPRLVVGQHVLVERKGPKPEAFKGEVKRLEGPMVLIEKEDGEHALVPLRDVQPDGPE